MTETRTAPVSACRACGSDLKHIDPTDHERRVHVDIVFETREVTVEAEIKTCPHCRAKTRGRFPNDMPGPLQYGHGVVALATHLLTAQMLSLRRAAQTLEALTGRLIAEATWLAWLSRLHEALADWETAAVQRLLSSPVLHADETGLRIDRKLNDTELQDTSKNQLGPCSIGIGCPFSNRPYRGVCPCYLPTSFCPAPGECYSTPGPDLKKSIVFNSVLPACTIHTTFLESKTGEERINEYDRRIACQEQYLGNPTHQGVAHGQHAAECNHICRERAGPQAGLRGMGKHTFLEVCDKTAC